jgi:hypothetical protein
MSTLSPKGEHQSNLFWYMFFFHLPPRIQELLGEDDQSSVVELAAFRLILMSQYHIVESEQSI